MIELLKDKYKIIRQAGEGGMAQIYLALDKETNKEVAIKVLEPNSLRDKTKQKRFFHEIRLLKRVDSPYVVKLFDAEISDHNCYITMEFVDGYILKTYIKNRSRLTVDEAVDFTKQMALGFDEIHKNGIVHRDIKSQNIMVTDNGRIKIIDFGIAVDSESEDLTKTDMLIGSPQYVSPELIRQEEPTPQSDIYALGILLYEMLAGDVPFSGTDPQSTLLKHRDKPMPRISQSFENVPQSVENIIIKATAKNPQYRYASMYDMFLDLKKCLDPEQMNVEKIEPDGKKKKTMIEIINSRGMLIAMIIFLLLVVLTLIVVFALEGF